MSLLKRASAGISALLDPVERRGYASRLRWLLHGTENLQVWSLEYRSGLTGRFAVPLERFAPDDEVTSHCPPDCLARSHLSHLYERRFVYRIQNTIASTASGATLACGSPEPAFFVRESIAWPFESIIAHGLDIPEVAAADFTVQAPAIVFPTTTNYYHWTVEELPLVLRGIEVAPHAQLLSFAPGITARHHTVAAHLKAPLIPSPAVVRLHDQVLPGRASDSFFIHPADLQSLRKFGESITRDSRNSSDQYPDKIYVSRRKSRRSLHNEIELEQLLQMHGFITVHLQELPWKEQIGLFQKASIVAGPHGAGLANLVFSSTGTKVIELTIGKMFNRCFEWICHIGDLNYVPIEADSESEEPSPAELAGQILDAVEY